MYSWLFTYVYKDIYENVYQNKEVAKIMVVLISAVIHEIMLDCSLRMFFPLLFIIFFGSGLVSAWCNIKHEDTAQIVAKFLFCWGSGFLLTAYSMEYNSRHYLPAVRNGIADYFIPRSLALFL